MMVIRSDNGALRITLAFMDLLTAGTMAPKIVTVCQAAEVSRTTFYNNFENLEDLEERFLQIYYSISPEGGAAAFPDHQSLRRYYIGVVRLMKGHREFFTRVFQDHELLKYRMRWFEIAEAPILAVFSQASDYLSPDVWKLHLDLAIGVLRRLWEVCLSGQSSDDERTVTLTMEFLWGGKERLRRVGREPGKTLGTELDPELRKRYQRRR